MLKAIRNRAGLVLAGLVAALCPMLMAPTGGLPSQPSFQTVSIGNAGGANPNQASGDPRHQLELVNNNGSLQLMAVSTYSTGAAFQNNVHWNRFDGVIGSPSAVASGDTFMSMGYRGWDGTGVLSQSMAAFYALSTEAWNSTNHGIKFAWDVCPPGGCASRLKAFEVDAISTANTPRVITNGTGDTSRGYLEFRDAGGTRYGYAGKASNGTITYESDAALQLSPNNGAQTIAIDTAGNLTITNLTSSPWAAAPVTSTFSMAFTGCTTSPTPSASYTLIHKIVVLNIPSTSCTSNATTFGLGTLPAGIRPTTAVEVAIPASVLNNGVATANATLQIAANGALSMSIGNNLSGWTAANSKGFQQVDAVTWALQ